MGGLGNYPYEPWGDASAASNILTLAQRGHGETPLREGGAHAHTASWGSEWGLAQEWTEGWSHVCVVGGVAIAPGNALSRATMQVRGVFVCVVGGRTLGN
jgi:hypothetical protein